jgi:tricorn protease
MFIDAWRLERDYFYDRGMHGLDWPKIRDKYLPLVDRVRTRYDLNDLVAQMVSELSALHTYVGGGDMRKGQDEIEVGSLGAEFTKDAATGGFRVTRIYMSDPDFPQALSPLRRNGAGIKEGDIIEAINGTATSLAPDLGVLLRNQAGRQVLLRVKPQKGDARDVVVVPMKPYEAQNLRYDDWEYDRRRRVEEKGKGTIGYVHLRAMGGANYAEWARDYYPVFQRHGLIIDVRHNQGGNIDSWILSKLLRKPWFYWQDRTADPYWNMHYAFRGHMVVLVDQWTASDGEAFAEGFKRLGLGKVIGMRTWGGEIWLSGSNVLLDHGYATAAEFGVYGPEGQWLIEGHGVEPDIVVDNLPRATFEGKDEQLEAAIKHLEEKMRAEPIKDIPPPPFPKKGVP